MITVTRQHGWRPVTAAAVLLGLAGLAGCGPDDDARPAALSPPAGPIAKITITPEDGAGKVRLDKRISVSVLNGTLATVAVSSKGKVLDGELADDKTSWLSSGALRAGAKYTVAVSAAGKDGKPAQESATFKTLSPKDTGSVWLQPSSGATVGVGMPVVANFTEPVAKSRRKKVEAAVTVTSTPSVEGDWRWVGSQQAQWRPKEFWPAHTKVKVSAKLGGVELDKGVWGTSTVRSGFTVGDAMISTVDVDKHTMTVRRNGTKIRTVPITTGKSGFETRNGTKVIMTRETTRRMDAATTGTDPKDPNYYNVVVKYAMRLTYSGEFLHAAPWSVGSQGHANVSHGCTGMSTANAKWMFDHSKVGDVVKYVGSPRALEPGNGWTAWNMSYAGWSS